ncbi:MAG: transposase [Prevotella sp.]|nr:transposase [Prevotella sp.]
MECINIRPKQIGAEKNENCKFTNVQVLNLLMLFPFFVVRNAYQYSGSSLSRLFCCKKDMFYRFMNDGNIKWRKLLYAMNLQLLRKISRSTEAQHDKPVCLIIDDTDAPKSGRKSELIGKIFSHLEHKSILGYKCLTLLLSVGLSQLFLDFSLHGEEGRKPDKKQGLTDKQRSERFSADYTGQSVEERIKEYSMKKTEKAIEMVKYAIKRGIRFDYLLVDSWFTCADFVRLITSRHIKCHLLGMIKLGKTKYHTQWGDLTANQIIEKLQKKGLTKHNRTLKCTYCTIDVKFAGTTVRLFFSKRGRKGQWNGLLTTDLSLSFLKAYRTYSMRWATEVAYHDSKQLLDFGKCQSVHFSAQIASFTLTMMQYNILCTVKRFEAYETIGALFRDATGNTLELTVTDRIWELILDTILEIAEIISADASELLSAVIDVNPKFHKIYQMYNLYAA